MRPTIHAIFTLAISAMLLAGCGSDYEKSTAYLKQSKQLEKNTNDVQTLQREYSTMYSRLAAVETMRDDFQKVSADVGRLVTTGGGSPDGTKALEDRIQALESRLQSVNEELAELKKGGRPAPARPADDGEISATPSKPQPSTPRRTTAPTATRTRHLIKAGETLDDIGRQYGVSADQIRRANAIPAGKNPAPGQRIIIPSK